MSLKRLLETITRSPRKGLFQALEVETYSPCNLRCTTCPNQDHRRPVMELPMEVIEKMVLELGELHYAGAFSPHFYNEPLLDKRLPDILTLVRHHAPEATINLFTNFTPMTPGLYRTLLPLVDEFIVTSDQPEVQRALDRVMPELSSEELTKLRTRSLRDSGLSNRAGALEGASGSRAMRACAFVNNLTVDAWGQAHLCCNDYYGKAVFGNVRDRSLIDIWFDKEYVEARRLGARAAHPLCRGCFWT